MQTKELADYMRYIRIQYPDVYKTIRIMIIWVFRVVELHKGGMK